MITRQAKKVLGVKSNPPIDERRRGTQRSQIFYTSDFHAQAIVAIELVNLVLSRTMTKRIILEVSTAPLEGQETQKPFL